MFFMKNKKEKLTALKYAIIDNNEKINNNSSLRRKRPFEENLEIV